MELGHEADHLLPSSAEVNYMISYLHSPMQLNALHLITHSSNFSVTYLQTLLQSQSPFPVVEKPICNAWLKFFVSLTIHKIH
jgi:hypothetical protein